MTTMLASTTRRTPATGKRRICFPITSRAYYGRSQLLMKKLQRQYEDEAESAAEEFKKLEQQLKAKYPQPKKLDGDKKAESLLKALSEEERKRYTELKDRSQRLADAAPRYRPMAREHSIHLRRVRCHWLPVDYVRPAEDGGTGNNEDFLRPRLGRYSRQIIAKI